MNFYKFLKAKKYFQAVIFILLFFVLSFSLIACFNNDNNKKQTKPITKINQKNSQKQATTTSSTTDQTIEQENQSNYILKKVGTDKNGWNIYRSQKYGFEFKAPVEWEIERYGKYRGEEYIYFNYFTLSIKRQNSFVQLIDNKDNFLQWKCHGANFDICMNNYKNIKFKLIKLNPNINIVKTIEGVGINEEAVLYYFFVKNQHYVYVFTFFDINELSDQKHFDIIKTFKIIK